MEFINVQNLHTTELGQKRIKQNLGLTNDNVVFWCQQAVRTADKDSVIRRGKNWYVCGEWFYLTINAQSHTIITAHKIRQPRKKPIFQGIRVISD
ncbi:MAG: DUF3781 domain-containing protein [Deltaproteobacteria bacterium]|nr:DUF3781 domain-containing protein [Deltaproteobacteria bacterium]